MLTKLGVKYGTDKVCHGYLDHYERYLGALRGDFAQVLEIGIYGGASLRMWRDYFIHAQIHGIDCDTRTFIEEERITCHYADQSSRESLQEVMPMFRFNMIVDDGSHKTRDQQITLACIFKYLAPGGLYFLEDLWTSFVPYYTDDKPSTVQVLEHFDKEGDFSLSMHMLDEEKEFLENECEFLEWCQPHPESIMAVMQRQK